MPPEQAANPLIQFIPAILIFLIFYFLLLKPQRDKQKEHKNMLTKVAKNDQVVTIGGIHATVINVKDTTVVIRAGDTVKFEVDKEALASITKKSNS